MIETLEKPLAQTLRETGIPAGDPHAEVPKSRRLKVIVGYERTLFEAEIARPDRIAASGERWQVRERISNVLLTEII